MSYAIGTPGQPWTDAHRAAWLTSRKKVRSYQEQVVSRIDALRDRYEVVQYGTLPYSPDLPLFGLLSRDRSASRPTALITGGVHGYETSGVLGALHFADTAADYADRMDLIIAPCVSPWGFERIERWNPAAIDPNRSFVSDGRAEECQALMRWLDTLGPVRVHIDLHETTDSDNTEFRPAKAARDGGVQTNWNIPDGFYLVARTDRPTPRFQAAIRDRVAAVTHIAEPDDEGELIGVPLQQPGVVEYDAVALGLAMGMTDAAFATTTEVYPDSPRNDPQTCILAQVAAVRGALDFVLSA